MACPVVVGLEGRILELMAACQYGSWEDVEGLVINTGASLYWEDPDKLNCLHAASMGNNYEVALHIKERTGLYDYRVMLHQRSRHGGTPLHIACRLGFEDLAYLFIDDTFSIVNDRGETPLYVACANGHERIVSRIVEEQNFDISAPDKTGDAPLHRACTLGLTGIVKLLLENNADVNCKNGEGEYPLLISMKAEHRDILELILQRSYLNTNVTDSDGHTALHLACIQNNREVAQTLITHGANPNILDESHASTLHTACTHGSSTIVELLLTSGAVLDTVNIHRETALYLACKNGHSETVGLLLDRGAKLHVENAPSPVQTAIAEKHRHVLETLAHHLSDTSATSGLSNTLLSCVVARMSDIVTADNNET